MEKPASEIVSALLEEALSASASDIHFSPQRDNLKIRFRIDGLLEDKGVFSKETEKEMIARLKVLAHLRSDEHFRPQDGRFTFVCKEDSFDVRISIVPAYYGENAVLRLLGNRLKDNSLNGLGFSSLNIEKIHSALELTSGLVLVTGPTGSGKTSTLYSLLSLIGKSEDALITLEDPVEYALSGVNQIQVNSHVGFSFATALRSILRQDPDVIMVGEIRDVETAKISINAALTGHILLSTLHTSDAVSVLPRFIEMGIEPYLIASTVKVIIAQRLVRRKSGNHLKGRLVISEVLIVTNEIRNAILAKQSSEILKRIALRQGMIDMYEDGLLKVEEGSTTRDEVLRAIHE
jgi:type II secretory ATPase GspE/PulE/Tfp pilus assembly ATPase PilB-like protein